VATQCIVVRLRIRVAPVGAVGMKGHASVHSLKYSRGEVDSAARRVAPLMEVIETVTPAKRSRRPADSSLTRKESILPKGAGSRRPTDSSV
jgi:hypothetical protein